MVNAVSFPISNDEVKSIPVDGCIKRSAQPQDHGHWIGVDYIILCSGHIPMWIAKVKDIALSRQDDGQLVFRFSEIRDVWGKGADAAYNSAYKTYRSDRANPQLTAFEDDSFFTIGERLPFMIGSENSGSLSIKKAAERLSETYDVEPNQVEIIIRHLPA